MGDGPGPGGIGDGSGFNLLGASVNQQQQNGNASFVYLNNNVQNELDNQALGDVEAELMPNDPPLGVVIQHEEHIDPPLGIPQQVEEVDQPLGIPPIIFIPPNMVEEEKDYSHIVQAIQEKSATKYYSIAEILEQDNNVYDNNQNNQDDQEFFIDYAAMNNEVQEEAKYNLPLGNQLDEVNNELNYSEVFLDIPEEPVKDKSFNVVELEDVPVDKPVSLLKSKSRRQSFVNMDAKYEHGVIVNQDKASIATGRSAAVKERANMSVMSSRPVFYPIDMSDPRNKYKDVTQLIGNLKSKRPRDELSAIGSEEFFKKPHKVKVRESQPIVLPHVYAEQEQMAYIQPLPFNDDGELLIPLDNKTLSLMSDATIYKNQALLEDQQPEVVEEVKVIEEHIDPPLDSVASSVKLSLEETRRKVRKQDEDILRLSAAYDRRIGNKAPREDYYGDFDPRTRKFKAGALEESIILRRQNESMDFSYQSYFDNVSEDSFVQPLKQESVDSEVLEDKARSMLYQQPELLYDDPKYKKGYKFLNVRQMAALYTLDGAYAVKMIKPWPLAPWKSSEFDGPTLKRGKTLDNPRKVKEYNEALKQYQDYRAEREKVYEDKMEGIHN